MAIPYSPLLTTTLMCCPCAAAVCAAAVCAAAVVRFINEADSERNSARTTRDGEDVAIPTRILWYTYQCVPVSVVTSDCQIPMLRILNRRRLKREMKCLQRGSFCLRKQLQQMLWMRSRISSNASHDSETLKTLQWVQSPRAGGGFVTLTFPPGANEAAQIIRWWGLESEHDYQIKVVVFYFNNLYITKKTTILLQLGRR